MQILDCHMLIKRKLYKLMRKCYKSRWTREQEKWTAKRRLLKYFYRNFMGVTIVVGFKVYRLVFVWSQCLVCWIGVRSLFKTSVVGWSMFGSSLDGFLFSICDEKVLHDRYSFSSFFFLFFVVFPGWDCSAPCHSTSLISACLLWQPVFTCVSPY